MWTSRPSHFLREKPLGGDWSFIFFTLSRKVPLFMPELVDPNRWSYGQPFREEHPCPPRCSRALFLIIPCGLCVSSNVVRASLPAVRLGYVIDIHRPRRPWKTPYRDAATSLIEGLGHTVLDFLSKKVITVRNGDIYADLKCLGPTRQSQCCCSPSGQRVAIHSITGNIPTVSIKVDDGVSICPVLKWCTSMISIISVNE